MGAIEKHSIITGPSLETAFTYLQSVDREEYGNDCYSGGWNNVPGVVEVSSKNFTKIVKEGGNKHNPAVAKVLRKPVLNNMKIKTVVKNYPQKGKRVWETIYIGENNSGFDVIIDKSQTEAIKKARAYVEKNPDESVKIYITKKLQSNSKVATVDYKKSKNQADGQWEIFGVAAY